MNLKRARSYKVRYIALSILRTKTKQTLTGETLNSGANLACDAHLDIHARGFWERQKSTFFDIRVCHPNADSYKDLTPEQVYCLHENEKKRMYERRVLEVEQVSFTPLVFTTTGGMGRECLRYHSLLAELISIKKGEDYAKTMTWIRGKVSFSILRSALLCLRGSRSNRRRTNNVKDIDMDVDLARSNIKWLFYFYFIFYLLTYLFGSFKTVLNREISILLVNL